MNHQQYKVFSIPVMVAALGYFVDIYDLVLFSIVRKKSLESLGIVGEALESKGLWLLNIQMIGMLIGGLLWGILGDKKGRLSVLFGSILMYSLANIANAYISNITQYGILRFIAGVGLAGELGAGITLVCEILPREKRGLGTTIVATVGVSGAILAAILGLLLPSWTTCYLIGGIMGLALLVLRVGVHESGMYRHIKEEHHELGSLKLLFSKAELIKKYLFCILVGLPIWYTIGILITLSPELGKELGIIGEVKPAYAIMYCYIGVTLGDLTSGLFSQWAKSRKKILFYYVLATLLCVVAYFLLRGVPVQWFYAFFILLGCAAGYWAVLITTSSEQFGTNIRATVTTSVPNFIRAALVPISMLYAGFKLAGIEKLNAALFTGFICCSIALWATTKLKESYGIDLNYVEK